MKPLTSPLWQAAMRRAARGECEFLGELEIGFRRWPGRVLAVTGSRRKNSRRRSSPLPCFRLPESDARPAGNIGYPLSDLAADLREGELLRRSAAGRRSQLVPARTLRHLRDICGGAAFSRLGTYRHRYAGGYGEKKKKKADFRPGRLPENRVYGLSMDSPPPRRVTLCGEAMMVGRRRSVKKGGTRRSQPRTDRENLAAAVELCLRVFLPKPGVVARISGWHESAQEAAGVRFVNELEGDEPGFDRRRAAVQGGNGRAF
ncbi:MAG: hypothetical protein V8T86_11520 [Victivallis sp.]